MSIALEEISGLVLAGGRGSRMGGVDKGLQNHHGMALALHALLRLQPQVGTVMINANRNLGAYEAMGVPVWPDAMRRLPRPAGRPAHRAGALRNAVPGERALRHAELPHRPGGEAGAGAGGSRTPTSPWPPSMKTAQLRTQPVFCLLKSELDGKPGRLPASGRTQDRPLDRDAPLRAGAVRRRRGVLQRQHAGRTAAISAGAAARCGAARRFRSSWRSRSVGNLDEKSFARCAIFTAICRATDL